MMLNSKLFINPNNRTRKIANRTHLKIPPTPMDKTPNTMNMDKETIVPMLNRTII